MKNLEEIEEMAFIIDMNDGFCTEGNLADPTIKRVVPGITETLKTVLERGGAIVVVNDEHTLDSVELKRYAPHCHNKEESRTIKELRIFEEYAIATFYKNSTCALFAPGMMEMLRQAINLKRVIITGCLTEVCVLDFAVALRLFFDQLNMDVEVVVPKNSVETYHVPEVHDRDENNNKAYEYMEGKGIRLVKRLEGEI